MIILIKLNQFPITHMKSSSIGLKFKPTYIQNSWNYGGEKRVEKCEDSLIRFSGRTE